MSILNDGKNLWRQLNTKVSRTGFSQPLSLLKNFAGEAGGKYEIHHGKDEALTKVLMQPLFASVAEFIRPEAKSLDSELPWQTTALATIGYKNRLIVFGMSYSQYYPDVQEVLIKCALESKRPFSLELFRIDGADCEPLEKNIRKGIEKIGPIFGLITPPGLFKSEAEKQKEYHLAKFNSSYLRGAFEVRCSEKKLVDAFVRDAKIENALQHLSSLVKLSAGNFSLTTLDHQVLECYMFVPQSANQLHRALELTKATLDLLEEHGII